MQSKMSSINRPGKMQSNSGWIHVSLCQTTWMTGESCRIKEKDLVGKVFGGLTLLDTMQSETGVQALRADIPYSP